MAAFVCQVQYIYNISNSFSFYTLLNPTKLASHQNFLFRKSIFCF